MNKEGITIYILGKLNKAGIRNYQIILHQVIWFILGHTPHGMTNKPY